jgi:hypothetical protein
MKIPFAPQDYDPDFMNRFIKALQEYTDSLDGSHGRLKYSAKNYTVTRTIDLKTATQADINNFLVTAIMDLFQAGLMP